MPTGECGDGPAGEQRRDLSVHLADGPAVEQGTDLSIHFDIEAEAADAADQE